MRPTTWRPFRTVSSRILAACAVFLLGLGALWASATPAPNRGQRTASVLRAKPNGRILKIFGPLGHLIGFYKETSMWAGDNHHDIFDTPMMNVYAFNVAQRLDPRGRGRIKFARSEFHEDGMEVMMDGQVQRLRPGLYQDAFTDMTDPVVAARRRFNVPKGELPTTDQVNAVLGERLDLAHTYFAMRTLMRGADMNIENFAWSSHGEILSFDNGDILLPSNVMRDMGVPDAAHNMFNMPKASHMRQPWRFNVGETIPEFRSALITLASMTPEALVEMAGMPASWPSLVRRQPRGSAGSVIHWAQVLLGQ